MKATEILEEYATWLSNKHKKYDHYLKTAKAFLRGRSALLQGQLLEEIKKASPTNIHKLNKFNEFVIACSYERVLLRNDLGGTSDWRSMYRQNRSRNRALKNRKESLTVHLSKPEVIIQAFPALWVEEVPEALVHQEL